ncbi:four helix bundle protein [Aurantiacibacter sediminis]|uniref:Four helix bundle protein n=1 Tax=Aurantiacibacter sediminis TaxID=2793064 RepID=A0ABS0N3K9_9SPHN|nr:four helix bundle protein [Aurantiacibacter sediminis]
MDLATAAYELSKTWPREEAYWLTSQVCRAASSAPANIAEGYGRQSPASYSHLLKIARGSLKELKTHLLLAERVGVSGPGTTDDILEMADEIGRMLGGLIRSDQLTQNASQ